MTIPQLRPPGVEIVQEYITASPTTAIPTLVPCVVGVCKEIREITNSDGTINTDILVSGPAMAKGLEEANYTAMDGLTIQLAVNGGVVQTFTMPTGITPPTGMSAQEVATAINSSTPAPVDFTAKVYTDDDDKYLVLETTATGSNKSITFIGGTALAKLGFPKGYTYYGLGSYTQDTVVLPQSSFPDPRGNIEELDFYEDTIRVFLDLYSDIREILRNESFLMSGSTIAIYNDGDGDQSTPYVDVDHNMYQSPSSASILGEVNLTVPQPLQNKTLIIQVDGAGKQTITFCGQPIVSTIASGWDFDDIKSAALNFSINDVTLNMTVPGTVADLDDLIIAINNEVSSIFGVDIAYECGSDGRNNGSGYLGIFYGASPGPTDQNIIPNTSVKLTGGAAMTPIYGGTTPIEQKLGKNASNEPVPDVVDQINNALSTDIAEWSTNYLRLTSPKSGVESKLEIDENSTALGSPQPNPTTLLGLDIDSTNKLYGNPFKSRPGDYLYADGTFLGVIVAAGIPGNSGRIKLDREVSISSTWSSWYIIAKNLDAVDDGEWGISVPTPDLVIDNYGGVNVKHDFLRNTQGIPVDDVSVGLYCMYEALRLDVTADAESPTLLSYSTTDEIETALGPIVPENPLAYGLYVAKVHAGNIPVSGLGVSEVSADMPNGTVEGFQKAFEYLEAHEVYAIAPMVSELSIATLGKTHVDYMSAPENKGERIVIVNLGTPSRKPDTIVVSGNNGDTVDVITDKYLETRIGDLSQALLALGIDPDSITVDDGVYIDLAADAYSWNVTGAVRNGTQLYINTSFAAGENEDAFYHEVIGELDPVISGGFSIKVRGIPVTSKDDEIETIYNWGTAFSDRRIWLLQLDKLRASVNGSDQLVDGFYACAAKAGQVAGLPASQPLSQYPLSIFTGVTGTNDRYRASQLNQGAAGGADWIIESGKPGSGTPLVSRHQLTTDLTSIEKREQSIVKAIDFICYFFRGLLKKYSGRYNITKPFLDTLSTILQSGCNWLVENGIVYQAAPGSIVQSTDSPDSMLCDIQVEAFYPGNYLRITLLI